MKCFTKKSKFCALFIAFSLLFNLAAAAVGFAEEELTPDDDVISEEELLPEDELSIEEELLQQEFEEFGKEDDSNSGEDTGEEEELTPEVPLDEEIVEETPEVEEIKTVDTFEYRFFKAAGILAPELYELTENTPMTRAQFISLAGRLCGLGNVTFPSTNSYWDVPANHWATSYIYGMRDMGYVNGYSEYEFGPDEAITFGQVLKITLNILGYGNDVVQKYGSYPQGYINLGSTLDMLPGIYAADAAVSCETALEILYNATEVPILDTQVKSGDYIYTKSEEKLLSQYHDIYEDEGILTFNGYTGLDSSSQHYENQVVIGDRVLERNGINVSELLGMKVRYFYRNDTSEPDLVYVEAKENANKVLIINAEDLAADNTQFSISRICYYDKNDKVKTADISDFARFIYNGRSYDEFDSDDYKIEAGTLRLISNSNSETYDVIVAEEFENCFVAAVDIVKKKIHDTYGGVIELEESDYVSIFNENGDSITLEDIAKNNVVSYFYSLDGENLVLYVSEAKVSGALSGVSESARGGIAYGIGDNEYRLAANVREAISKNLIDVQTPELGDTYEFYLDKSGFVAGLIKIEEPIQYALFCKSAMGKGFNADTCMLQLVLENGEHVIAQTADKFKVNGERITASALKSRLDTYSPYPVIRVAFNGLGEIKEIELAADRSTYDDANAVGDKTDVGYNDERFTMDYSSEKVAYRGSSIMVFYDKYRMNPDTVVFHLPYKMDGEEIEPEEVMVVPSSYLSHGQAYNVVLYDADATLSVNAVVAQPTNFGYYNGLFVVNKVLNVTNENGEDVIRVDGFWKGVMTSLTEREAGVLLQAKATLTTQRPDLAGIDKTRVKKGDVFRFYAVDGEIAAAQLLYSCSAPKQRYIATFSQPTRDRLYNNQVLVVGPVHAASAYAVTTVNPDEKTEVTGDISSHTLYNTIILVYDSENQEVYLGSMADILPNVQPDKTGTVSFDDNSTWICIFRQSDTASEIVVLK